MLMMEVYSSKKSGVVLTAYFSVLNGERQSALDGLPERIPDMQQRVNFCEKNAIKRYETLEHARFSNTSFATLFIGGYRERNMSI
jgi:hypothetical protein